MKSNALGMTLLSTLIWLMIESVLLVALVKQASLFYQSYHQHTQRLKVVQSMRWVVYTLLNAIHQADSVSFQENGAYGSTLLLGNELYYVSNTHRKVGQQDVYGLYHKNGGADAEEIAESVTHMGVIDRVSNAAHEQLMTLQLTVGDQTWNMKAVFSPKKVS